MLFTDIRHFLDTKGAIALKSKPDLKFAEFIGSLIAASTFSSTKTANSCCFICGSHVTSVVSHTEHIAWQCNSCNEEGVISNWQGTLWDLTDNSVKNFS
ncbi:MAG: hypothetical protein V4525_08210 [Pseudomonadota bacterium]